MRLDLQVDEVRRFGNGMVYLDHRVRGTAPSSPTTRKPETGGPPGPVSRQLVLTVGRDTGPESSAIRPTVGVMTSDAPERAQPITPRLDLVILDCPDAHALGRFYAQVLGWAVEDGSDERFTTLEPPGGGVSPDNPDGRTTLAFQQIEDWAEPTWPGGAHPQQVHLDFSVPDIDAAEPAVLAAGARVDAHQPSTDGGFRVYLDPVGHPFCLIRG